MSLFLFSISVSFIIYIWLDTNAFIEYYQLLDGGWSENANEYIEDKNTNGHSVLFSKFLFNKYNKFLIRLITCPFCIATWIGIISILFFGIFCFAVSFISVFFYFLLKYLVKISIN